MCLGTLDLLGPLYLCQLIVCHTSCGLFWVSLCAWYIELCPSSSILLPLPGYGSLHHSLQIPLVLILTLSKGFSRFEITIGQAAVYTKPQTGRGSE